MQMSGTTTPFPPSQGNPLTMGGRQPGYNGPEIFIEEDLNNVMCFNPWNTETSMGSGSIVMEVTIIEEKIADGA